MCWLMSVGVAGQGPGEPQTSLGGRGPPFRRTPRISVVVEFSFVSRLTIIYGGSFSCTVIYVWGGGSVMVRGVVRLQWVCAFLFG